MDEKDAEWIADPLQQGHLSPSYIPDRDQRELRELVSYRKSLIQDRTRELNRLHHSIGMPVSMTELGLEPTEEQILEMAYRCALAAGGQKGSAAFSLYSEKYSPRTVPAREITVIFSWRVRADAAAPAAILFRR